jgi:hypothetical protein
LVGVMTQRQMITDTKANKWTLQKIPSASGRCFAQKMLKGGHRNYRNPGEKGSLPALGGVGGIVDHNKRQY